MEITQLRKRRGRLYLLVLDGEPAMTVDARTFDESPYREGVHIDDEQLKELLDASTRRRAQEKALYLLSMRDHSKGELTRKLSREAEKSVAMETAARMEEWGYVDDESYAPRLARDLHERKHYPARRVAQELMAKGIARELAYRVLQEETFDDTAQAVALLQKKYSRRLEDEDDRRKTMAALARYGFDYQTIRRAFAEIEEE